MASEVVKCLCIIVAKCYDLRDWISDLEDCSIIPKDQAKSLSKRVRKGETERVLEETCELALEKRDGRLLDAFKEEEFEGDPRCVAIILKILRDGRLCPSIAWMITSWDILNKSDAIQLEATKFCENLSESDWLLDFIHHMLTTANLQIRETFVNKAKLHLGMVSPAENSPPESNNVESFMNVAAIDTPEDDSSNPDADSTILGGLDSEGENEKQQSFPASLDKESEETSILNEYEVVNFPHDIGRDAPDREDEEYAADDETAAAADFPVEDLSKDCNPDFDGSKFDEHIHTPPSEICSSAKPFQSEEDAVLPMERRKQTIGMKDGAADSPLEVLPPRPTPRKRRTMKTGQENFSLPTPRSAEGYDDTTSRHSQSFFSVHMTNLDSSVVGDNSSVKSQSPIKPEASKRKKPSKSEDIESVSPKKKTPLLEDSSSHKNLQAEGKIPMARQDSNKVGFRGDAENIVPLSTNDRKESGLDAEDLETAKKAPSPKMSSSAQDKIPVEMVGKIRKDAHPSQQSSIPTESGHCTESGDRSRSGSSSGSNEDAGPLNVLISSAELMQKYQHNLVIVVKMAWPDKPSTLEEWPFALLLFLREQENSLANRFADMCLYIMQITKPYEAMFTRKREVKADYWILDNLDMVNRNLAVLGDLCHLVWPDIEWHHEKKIVTQLLKKCQKHNSKVHTIIDALVSINTAAETTENSKGPTVASTGHPSEAGVKSPDEKPIEVKKLYSEAASGSSVMVTAGTSSNTIPEQTHSANSNRKIDDNLTKANSSSHISTALIHSDQKYANPAGKSKTSQKYVKGENSRGLPKASHQPKDSKTSQNKKLALGGEAEETEEKFFDASSVMPDGFFEIRAVFTTYPPEITRMYIIENCWSDFEYTPMTYNSERRFYFVDLPRKIQDFKFEYKYYVIITGVGEYWEYLPSFSGTVANRIASVKKGTRFFHDAPLFHCQRALIQDDIAAVLWMHLPPICAYHKDGPNMQTLQKHEIESCVAQFKSGWSTTAHKHYHVDISDKHLENVGIMWISKCIPNAKSQKEKMMRVLAVFHFACSLCYWKHRTDSIEIWISIFYGLDIRGIDASNLKSLRKILHQYYGNDRSVPLMDVFITLFRKINTIVKSSSPSLEWILTLPLYWLVVYDGYDRSKMLAARKRGGPLFQKSMLPTTDGLSWQKIAKDVNKDECQRYLLTMSEIILEYAENFPWIVDTFIYFLNRSTLLDILKSRSTYEISCYFSLDSVLYKLCVYEISHNKSQAILDAVQTEQYFDDSFNDIMQGNVRCTWGRSDGLLDSSKNMLQWLSTVVGDANSYLFDRESKMIMFIMKIANWTAEHIFRDSKKVEDIEFALTHLQSILKTVCQKIPAWSKLDTEEMQFVNELLKLHWSEPHFRKEFTSMILTDAERRMKSYWGPKKKDFFKKYLDNWKEMEFEKCLEECLEQYALRCTDSLLQDRSWKGWWGASGKEFLLKMLLQQYEKILNSAEIENFRPVMYCVYFLSKWPFASRILQALSDDQSLVESLEQHPQKSVKRIETDFRQAITCFCHGALTVSESRYILRNETVISEFYNILHEKVGSDVDMRLSQNMELTRERLGSIEVAILSLKCFISHCESIDHGKVEIHVNELEEMPILKDGKMKEILQYPGKPAQIISNEVLSEHDLTEIQLLHSVSESKIFEQVWDKAVQQFCETAFEDQTPHICSWKEALDNIWRENGKRKISSISDDIFSGSLQVSELPQLFGKEPDKALIAAELGMLAQVASESTTNVLSERVNQIYQYFRLVTGAKVANNIDRLKRRIGLTGNFSSINFAKRLEKNGDTALRNIIITDGDTEIDEIWTSNELSKVLVSFVEQKRLLGWLIKTMKDLNEVKTFCDLGMISAGESSDKVNHISCFLSAVTGFAPLIYNLKKDAKLKDVVKAISAVKRNLDADPNLLTKWTETGNYLERLKEIGKLHGSEGTQSLALAKSINRGGVYTIFKPEDEIPTIDTCLKLSVEIKKEKNVYSYANLKDLQSKLMLIAGDAEDKTDKGKNDVAKFNDTMNSVANLAEVFVNLLKSGCMLFNTWSATIMCNAEGFDILISFDKKLPAISMPSTLDELEKLIGVLKDALSSWIDYIEIMRLKHYHLNDYSISQMSYLCEKLAKSEFEDQVFCLLSDLPREDVEGQLQDIVEKATEVVEKDVDVDIQDGHSDEQETKLDAKKRIVRTLAKQKIPENVAKAAVQCETNNLDIIECEIWILDNQHDSDLVAELAEEFDKESGFGHDPNSSNKPVSLLHNRTESTLAQLISQLQTIINYENENVAISSIVEEICKTYNDKTTKLTLQDFLSIDHLGMFLSILRLRLSENKKKLPQRDMQAPMEPGKPNLILVPFQDMLLSTVALYMEHTMGKSLPTASEVLVCTRRTTKDQAGRFLRRALCKNAIEDERRLYVMTCADQLTFTVSEYVEKLFNTLSKKDCLDSKYQLVILSSSADPQHYLVTCFERTRVEMKISFDVKGLSKYVRDNLEAKKDAVPADHLASAKLVLSNRSGVGKSLHIRRLIEEMNDGITHISIIRLLEREIDIDHMLRNLYRGSNRRNENPHLIHIDLTSAVQHGLEEFAFNLFILRSIQDSQGCIWRHHCQHFYAVEMTKSNMLQQHSVLNLLPQTECLAPKEVLEIYESDENEKLPHSCILMDEQEFHSEVFQRPYQYLCRYAKNGDLDNFIYTEVRDNKRECLKVLLDHCGMVNPTWAQLKYFSTFLNFQLVNCEESIFCKRIDFEDAKTNEAIEFKGLKAFSVYFMIKMAQDFTTPSLNISDESARDAENALGSNAIRRRWEEQVHPFVFFNEDKTTMTFINVHVNDNGDLLNSDGSVAKQNMVSKLLLLNLKLQGVPIGRKFDSFNREEKLMVLCQFMNIPHAFDPDKTYELTTDNMLKILALYMRMRCQIPVIVMGETGCGKTRMIEFMSKLKQGQYATVPMEPQPSSADSDANAEISRDVSNMVTLKVHGGISSADIYACVEKAMHKAQENANKIKKQVEDKENPTETVNLSLTTTLFFDEANTTRAIFAIKEAVCDLTIDGKDFKDSHLQIVAACNPYKKLSKKAVKKLEESGLGYNINASETEHLGGVPMRQLVYRVVALPPSLQPFVWDFGQLGKYAEEIYIRQMTNRLVGKLGLNNVCEPDAQSKPEPADLINGVLFGAQCHMRAKCEEECRYVSLRDVERCLKTFEWFYCHKDHIFPYIEEYHKDQKKQHPEHAMLMEIPECLRCLIHTVGICYHASLDDRESFLVMLSDILKDYDSNCYLSPSQINLEMVACQTVFTQDLKMEDDIACNEALRENVFLMTVCTDLRIPLFVVGKPGSSKSLAKTILSDNMQGIASHSELYKNFKEVHIVSYQCSAHTDAAGIETIFRQCSQLQSTQNIKSYAAVVVLDEIGLAEDSPNMPLKVLHPLLECGSTENGTLTEFDIKKKVAFIGISNWALDPAKMNRGIFVTRGKSSSEDLFSTAKIIFKNRQNRYGREVKLLTRAYGNVYETQDREYFGLRDYYSLIKMLQSSVSASGGKLDENAIKTAIQRNFSGKTDEEINLFYKTLKYETPAPLIPVQEMVKQNLQDDKSRFLLLLANQYSTFSLLQNFIPDFNKNVRVIFGSSFPNDHCYTEMCRNINRVKVCMEQGKTIILLNLTEINESLYDALNQHYVTLGGERYVDVALGGHRVKCKVAAGFRLIVIELKDKVYKEYPIPLINRLEKHHLTSRSLLSEQQKVTSNEISEWITKFSQISDLPFTIHDAFPGHNDDSVSSVVISNSKVEEDTMKQILLQSATMDAVFRLPRTTLGGEVTSLIDCYLNEQSHGNLCDLLRDRLQNDNENRPTLIEITTFSHIMSDSDRRELEEQLGMGKNTVMLLSLQQFQTEQEYLKKVDEFFIYCGKENASAGGILLVQCPQAHKHVQLIACARYGLKNRLSQKAFQKKIIVVMMLSTERGLKTKLKGEKKVLPGAQKKVLSLQHNNDCQIIYIDELRSTSRSVRKTRDLHENSVSDILRKGLESDKGSKEDEQVIDLPTLIKDSICGAMAKVKNAEKDGQRNLQRIKCLSQLCATDSQTGQEFLQILTGKMIQIQDERQGHSEKWVEEEACSAERLQEGGTFSKTLWLCLRRHVSRLMAYVLSIIDKEDNLDLVTKNDGVSKPIHDAWLHLFSVIPVSWNDVMGCDEFNVPAKKLCDTVSNGIRIPFGCLIYEAFEEVWAVSKETASNDLRTKVSCNVFANNHKKISDTLKSSIFLSQEYMSACAIEILLLGLSAHHTTVNSLAKVVVKMSEAILENMKASEGNYQGQGENSEPNMFLLMFLATKKYHREIGILEESMLLHQHCMEQLDDWMMKLNNQDTYKVYHHAIKHLLGESSKMALEINDSTSCVAWMDFISLLRPIFNGSIDIIDDIQEKEELKKKWEPIAILDMLLLHLLPDPSQKEKFNNYIGIISTQAKLLFKGASRSAINGQQFLRIVCNILRKYLEDIQLLIVIAWGNKMCRICRRDCSCPVVLPCGHYFCKVCLEKHMLASRGSHACILCSEPIANDFNCEPTALTPTQQLEVGEFKRSCTSLFLEYLSQFVFRKQTTEMSASPKIDTHIKLIFEQLIAVKNTENRRNELETLGLDLNQVTRSSIVTILWNYNSEETEKTINDLFSSDTEDREAFSAVLLHFERMAKVQLQEHIDLESCLEDSIEKLQTFVQSRDDVEMTSEYIRMLAAARCSFVNFVEVITDENIDNQDEAIQPLIDSFVYNVKHIVNLSKDESIKEFIVKVGCRTYGLSWFSETFMKDERMKELVPIKLQQEHQPKVLDLFSSLNPIYHEVLSQLQKTSAADYVEMLKKSFDGSSTDPLDKIGFIKLLALSTWLVENQSYYTIFNAHFAKMPQNFRKSFDGMTWVVENLWPLISASFKGSEQHTSTLKQLVLLISGAIHLESHFTSNMKLMMEDPNQLQGMFWPAMPESFYFSMPESVRTVGGMDAMYQCPNGHSYTIGECTKPWTVSSCPDCHAVIGGALHQAAEGNQRVQKIEESSQAGYMLNKNEANLQQPQDRISLQASSVMQLLVHVCMLHGFQQNPASSICILGEQMDWAEYLIQQIDNNLKDFSKAIGRNKDEGILIIFSIMNKLLEDMENMQLPSPVADWSTIQSRKTWESQFRETYLLPIFQNLDEILQLAHENLSEAEDMTAINLFRIVYEIDELNDEDTISLWSYTQHPSVQHLMQCIRDGASLQKGSILQTILKTPQIEELKYLEGVLKLQQTAVAEYQNKLDLRESEENKLKDFPVDSKCHDLLHHYMEAWKVMSNQLQEHGKTDKQMQAWLKEELTLSSPISSLLPSTRGRGKCAKLLAEHLAEKHNRFLQECFGITGVNVSEREADANLLATNHFVKIDTKTDLLSMLYRHTSHHIKKDNLGNHQHITYNLDALEKQAREKVLSNKKIILMESLPCIKYTQDIGIGSDWSEVLLKTKKQEPLSPKLIQDVDDRVNNVTSAEVCEGVRTLTYAISFLAKVECDHNRQILEYLEFDLLLPKARTAVIPRFAKIHHTLALYQHFTWRKAVGFVQQGLQPYREALSQIEEERIKDPQILKRIETAFKHMNVVIFQQRFNEMLIKIPDYDGNRSLVDNIFPKLDLLFISNDETKDAWFDKIPSEVLFKHASHLFELAVNHEQRKTV